MPLVYFVTLSRSDYASLRPVMRAALKDDAITTKIIAGGSHLLQRYGNSIAQIRKDGLPIHDTMDFLREQDDTPQQMAAAYARATNESVRIFSEGKPDYVFILGDRWEMLPVAGAASMLHIPIIHHSGGDITQGSADNQTRYALTCLSHLHLVALPEHQTRLHAMGEEDWRIITTGEPALTELSAYISTVPDIRKLLGLKPKEPFVLATFHPTSFDTAPPEKQIDIFLGALDAIKDTIILTAPNPDQASRLFFEKLKAYAEKHAHVHLFESLGAEKYYAAMASALYMIGNSSSGLWEAPSFRLPVVNIGARQQGRVHGDNVIHAPLELAAIKEAIQKARSAEFRNAVSGNNPYAQSDTLALIMDALKQPHDKTKLLAKRLVDPLHARTS